MTILRSRNFRPWRAIAALGLCAFVLCGCGPTRPKTVKVTGKATFGGQPFPKQCIIYFNPVEAAPGFPRRPGMAEVDLKNLNVYSAKTFEGVPGLMPGRYEVSFECWEVPPHIDATDPPQSYLPEKYQSGSTSGLTLEVKAGSEPMVVDYDIPRTAE
jgi:hypothetical protein